MENTCLACWESAIREDSNDEPFAKQAMLWCGESPHSSPCGCSSGRSRTIFSRKCDYGLRALIYLAEQREKSLVTLTDIADTLHIPRAFLSKILQQLTRSEIVRSVKGPSGGFTLRVDPKELTLERVVTEIEGPIKVFDCFADGDCCFQGSCQILGVFDSIAADIRRSLSRVTLAQLLPKRPESLTKELPAS